MTPGTIVIAFLPRSKHLTDKKEYVIKWISAGGYYAVKNDFGKVKPYSPDNFVKK